jgi:hypothetical protein
MKKPDLLRKAEILSPGFLGGFTFPDWIKLLAANNWRIDFPYWPRACIATFGTLLTSLLKLAEHRVVLDSHPEGAWRHPLFVLGLPRSGTTHLFHLLSRDSQFCFGTRLDIFNPHTFLTLRALGAAELLQKLPTHKRPMDNVLTGWLTPEEDNIALAILCGFGTRVGMTFPRNKGHLVEEFNRVAREGGADEEVFKASLVFLVRKLSYLHKKPVLLKSPSHTLAIPQILRAFPSARFVAIVRSPVAQYASLAAMRNTSAQSWSVLQKPPVTDDEVLLERIGFFAKRYCETRSAIPPDQLVEVRYEDLVANEEGALNRIYSGLRLVPRLVPAAPPAAPYQRNRHPELPNDIKTKVRAACSPFYDLGLCRD